MNRKELAKSAKEIAVAYVILLLDINLGSVNILPDWLGYAVIVIQLPVLAQWEPSAALLRNMGIGLGAWELIQWGATIAGTEFLPDLSLVAVVLGLYFHFQLLTDLSRCAGQEGWPEAKKLLHLRTVKTLLQTVMAIPWPALLGEELTNLFALALLAVSFAAAVWTVILLFGLAENLEKA